LQQVKANNQANSSSKQEIPKEKRKKQQTLIQQA
jgi:hypothetical protein